MAWGKVKDQDFIGKEAHVRHREEEPAAVMCTLTVDDHTSRSGVKRYMLGGEPILTRDGEPLTDGKGRRSYVTSAGAGPSIGKHILMSYLPPEHAMVGDAARGRVHGRALPGDRADATTRRRCSTPRTRASAHEHPGVREAGAADRRQDRPDRRRAGDLDPPPRLHGQPPRGVRGRGGGAAGRAARRLLDGADAGPARGRGAAARHDGDRGRSRGSIWSRDGIANGIRRPRRQAIAEAIQAEPEPLRPDPVRQRVGRRRQLPGGDPGRATSSACRA